MSSGRELRRSAADGLVAAADAPVEQPTKVLEFCDQLIALA
jgi:hypothetical protein